MKGTRYQIPIFDFPHYFCRIDQLDCDIINYHYTKALREAEMQTGHNGKFLLIVHHLPNTEN